VGREGGGVGEWRGVKQLGMVKQLGSVPGYLSLHLEFCG
jgi:hypothetical protein